MPIFLSLAKSNPTMFVMIVATLVFSISLHEYFHARCALWMGDSTAADTGHLTLNPFRQMGWISLVMLLVAGIAWGAVPVDPVRLRSRHSWGPLATALAGPAANLLLAVIAWCLFGCMAALVPVTESNRPILFNALSLLAVLGCYNIVLLLFNLIPAPGLDGWNVLCWLFPRIVKVSSEVLKGVMVFLILAALMGVHYLFSAAEYVMSWAPHCFRSLAGS